MFIYLVSCHFPFCFWYIALQADAGLRRNHGSSYRVAHEYHVNIYSVRSNLLVLISMVTEEEKSGT